MAKPAGPDTTLPTPLSAGLGLLASGVDKVRELPIQVVRVPVLALSAVLEANEAVRREYDELAQRGEQLVESIRQRLGRRKGGDLLSALPDELPGAADFARSGDDVLDRAVSEARDAVGSVSGTVSSLASTAARRAGRVAETAQDKAGTASTSAGRATAKAATVAGRAASRAADVVEDGAEAVRGDLEEAGPTQAAPAHAPARQVAETVVELTGDMAAAARSVGTAAEATGQAVAETVEEVVDPFDLTAADGREVADVKPGSMLSHDELPLADYDHMNLPQLRGRLRKLDLGQLVQLRDYERTHAHRLPVATMLDNRIEKVSAEQREDEAR